jgi:CDP-diacylglycerol---serine O-phosphatidyltransferase
MVFLSELTYATYLVWAAAIFDFLDGFLARQLNAFSLIGKELDSLADMVTFGVLPAMIMFNLISYSSSSIYLPYISFLIAIFSALRLANFNIDTRQLSSFIGLPTPANALFISSLPVIIAMDQWGINNLILNTITLLTITIIFSFLLVAELPLFSLKFKNYAWKSNQIRYLFLTISILLLISLKFVALPLIILIYIILSILKNSLSNEI